MKFKALAALPLAATLLAAPAAAGTLGAVVVERPVAPPPPVASGLNIPLAVPVALIVLCALACGGGSDDGAPVTTTPTFAGN